MTVNKSYVKTGLRKIFSDVVLSHIIQIPFYWQPHRSKIMSHNINNVIMTASDSRSRQCFWMTCAEDTNPPISLELHSTLFPPVILLLLLFGGCRECPLNAETCRRWHGDAKGSEKANLPSLQWGAWCPFHLCQWYPRHHTSGVWNESCSERVLGKAWWEPSPCDRFLVRALECVIISERRVVCVFVCTGKSGLKLLSESPNAWIKPK